MKRLIGIVAALIIATLLPVLTASPAQAYLTGKKCFLYYDVSTCVEVQFRKQDDGSGVRVEGFWINTPQGCGSLEDSGGKYVESQATFTPVNSSTVYNQRYDSAEPCDVYHDLEWPGKDTGSMEFHWEGKARVDWADDRRLYITIKLNPDGTSSVEHKNIIPA